MISAIVLAAISLAEFQSVIPIPPYYAAIVADAKQRYTHGDSDKNELLENKAVLLIQMGQDVCVDLFPIDASIGNRPTYCYSEITKKFVKSYQNE